jgi:molybdopterin/thiamine biosynthesis adenylyltransferase
MNGSSHRKRVGIHPDEEDRYDRQRLITWWDQERLRDAVVLVVGAGALGNELVKNLVLIGVGTVVVADLDRVENSNLARCVFFRTADEGRFKAEVLAQRASELNPDVELVPLVGDVRLTAGLALYLETDVVLGGLDNREARLFVNQACWKTSTPWIDGAIEGLMGIVRVFVPPETACYECTMSERDHELIAARQTCAMLSREDMLAGKVPTTATTSSVVAAVQVQEAVKLLHADVLGTSALAGAGLQFVGLTHDSYVVRYTRRDDCLSHDTYELQSAEAADPAVTFGELLLRARERLGGDSVLDLEHEIVLGATCGLCGCEEEMLRPVAALEAGKGLCPRCGNPWQLRFTHSLALEDESLLQLTPGELGLPPGDVVVGRAGFDRCFFTLNGDRSALATVRAGRSRAVETRSPV